MILKNRQIFIGDYRNIIIFDLNSNKILEKTRESEFYRYLSWGVVDSNLLV